MTNEILHDWSRYFGLAHAPLFEAGEINHPHEHAVLLDGGLGSFVLSNPEEPFSPNIVASWAWSSGMPNHVTVTNETVVVTRWDTPHSTERYTLKSVSEKLDTFYHYLTQRRPLGRRDIVATLLDLFRAVRGEVEATGADDTATIDEFLNVLAGLLANEKKLVSSQDFSTVWNSHSKESPTGTVLDEERRQRLEVGFKNQILSTLGLDLSASLAVRHAAGAIFQEAHFAFQSSTQSDLFGSQPESSVKRITRGTHHFTPPPLARSIAEQALSALPNVMEREELTICDPACGSGAFLTETLRTLRRIGFNGRLKLVGRDLSPSAVAMATFSLGAAKFDWQPSGGTEIDLRVADTLNSTELPNSDIVVMNPPFYSWSTMNKAQRDQVSDILGSLTRHRPDMSMAFVTNALNAVKDGGVVASLIPSSVLTLSSGKEWRKDLLGRARLAFLGSFGDYGLFAHALVQVAAIVLVAGDAETRGLALKSANEAIATGEALRALRRIETPTIVGASGKGWRIAPIDKRQLQKNDRWRFLPPAVENALSRTDKLGVTRVDDLFDVKQGVLTGLNEAFILEESQLAELPLPERKHFRPALFRDSMENGVLREKYFVFFPYNKNGLAFSSESEVKDRLPTYFSRHLFPHKEKLQNRSGIKADDKTWWRLSRYYSWTQKSEARILTKYFGAAGDFAVDESARFIPLQGYVWFLKRQSANRPATESSINKILHAYCHLLNSKTFSQLLSVYSEPVAGGQFNLSARFVRQIPLPNLASADNFTIVDELSNLAETTHPTRPVEAQLMEKLIKRAWGEELVSALAEMGDG